MRTQVRHRTEHVIDRTRGHSLRIYKRRVKRVVRQGTFTQRVVNAWNGLPGKEVAAETADKFNLN